MTVREAAQKWGVSERLAQRYCTEGRIEGAAKFSGSWAIPADAEKPADPRKEAKEQKEKNEEKNLNLLKIAPMPLVNTAFELGHCREAVDKIEDENLRNIALSEYYYFSGQSEKASDIAEKYLESDDISIRLSACWIYAYANLALDRIPKTMKILGFLKTASGLVSEEAPVELQALIVFVATAAAVLLHIPIPEDLPRLKPLIHKLPPGLRVFAMYVQAHRAYLQKAYAASLGLVEATLALEGEDYPIPTIYLHLIATMNYMSLRMPEDAKAHLLAAWALAHQDDLIEPLSEHHGLLGGMLEAVIKKEWPDDFKRMISITYSFSAGWRKIHNHVTGRSVADNLTTTEFACAMLAARSWSNKEIAAHMGISENTVRRYISNTLQKLNISQRKELKEFMLH